MKSIFICLVFIVVSAMGETNYNIDKSKIEKNLSEEERFEMLFGKTGLVFNKIRKERTSRNKRSSRKLVSNRFDRTEKVEDSSLSQEERYELLFRKTVLRQRVARVTRLIFPRQARESLYLSYHF